MPTDMSDRHEPQEWLLVEDRGNEGEVELARTTDRQEAAELARRARLEARCRLYFVMTERVRRLVEFFRP